MIVDMIFLFMHQKFLVEFLKVLERRKKQKEVFEDSYSFSGIIIIKKILQSPWYFTNITLNVTAGA